MLSFSHQDAPRPYCFARKRRVLGPRLAGAASSTTSPAPLVTLPPKTGNSDESSRRLKSDLEFGPLRGVATREFDSPNR